MGINRINLDMQMNIREKISIGVQKGEQGQTQRLW